MRTTHGLHLVAIGQRIGIAPPDTLAEAERYYIDTLAKAIAEAQNMDYKSRLTSKLTRFMQEVELQWN